MQGMPASKAIPLLEAQRHLLMNFWKRAAVASASVVLSTLLTLAVEPALGDKPHYLAFTLAIIISAWYGGLLFGVAATIASFLIVDYLFVAPVHHLVPIAADGLALLALFLVVGLSISLLQSTIAAANERLRRSREQIELAAESAKIGFTESLEGGKVIWTPEMERLFGLEASAFEGTIGDWLRRIHPEDRIRFDDERRNQIAQRIPEVSYEDPASGRPDPLVRGPEAADYGTRWFDETCKR